MKLDFLTKHKTFDKLLKKKRKSYQRSEIYSLEKANTNDPVAFWRHIASLGPKGSSGIPMEVYDGEGNIVNECDVVMNKWKEDFEGLLKAPVDKSPEQM